MAKAAKKPKKKIGSARKGSRVKQTAAEKTQTPGDGGIPPLLAGNMPPIKDLLYHLEQIAGYQAKAKTASMAVTKAKNAAKSAGVDLKALSESQGLIGMDPLDMATYFRQLQAIMQEKGMPIQLQLYEPKFGSVEDQASHEGWNDGTNGRTPNTTRWPEGTPGHVQYMRRWNDGQKEIVTKGAGGKGADKEEGDDE